MNRKGPDYKRIYSDMLNIKYPDSKEACAPLMDKPELSVLDIIELNHRIFGTGSRSTQKFSQMHRSYNESTILQILDYQKKNGLNNKQLANHYKISRNTITKWKKLFV